MSLPGNIHREALGEFQLPTTRRRHRSGPHGIAEFGEDIPDNSRNNNGEEEDISNINFVQICNRNLGQAYTVSDPDPIKVTKLISRTIRLNLNVMAKDGSPLSVQASPKAMKRCQRTDVRDVFKERISLGSPRASPKFVPRHARRASDFSKSPVMNDLRDSRSHCSVDGTSKGYASVVNYAWNIPPVKW